MRRADGCVAEATRGAPGWGPPVPPKRRGGLLARCRSLLVKREGAGPISPDSAGSLSSFGNLDEALGL
jgi:hypothetical protein